MSDCMTFYGAIDLEARRRALRFQAENLDYVLTAVVHATWDLWAHSAGSTCAPGEQSITMAVGRHRPSPGSTVSGTRIILLERAAAMLKLPKEEAMAMAYAGGDDATAAEQLVRLEVVQKERHRSLAAMRGATCRATGWLKTAPHGYEGANAEVWRKAWDYCDSALRHEASKDDDEDDVSRLVPVYEPKVARSTEDDDEHYIPHKVDYIRLSLGRAGALGYVKYTNGVNTTLAPGSAADVLRAAAKVAGWKYACVNRPGEPRQTLLWVEGGSK